MAFDKRRLRREIEKDRRAAVLARLVELKGLVKLARVARDDAIRVVRADCAVKRQELRDACALRRTRAKMRGNEEVAQRLAVVAGERSYEKTLRGGGGPSKLRSTARERGMESDDEVRSNIAADLVPVFNKVRREIKGTPRKSRTETFLQWVEENTGEVFELMQHAADRELAKLLKEQEQLSREHRRKRPRRASGGGGGDLIVVLDDVPF